MCDVDDGHVLTLLQLGAAQTVKLAKKAQVLAGRQFSIDRQLLRDDADEPFQIALAASCNSPLCSRM